MGYFVASGNYIDLRIRFETKEEAEEQIKKWVKQDKEEGYDDTENDYYIKEETQHDERRI